MSSYRLSDINGGSVEGGGSGRSDGGCYVTTVTGFVLVLISILIAVLVGLVVHLAAPGEVMCHCHYDFGDNGGVTAPQGGNTGPTTPATGQPDVNSTEFQQCLRWAESGHYLICSACANANFSQTTTTEPATTPTPEIIKYRLPTNTKPFHYNLDLKANMYSGDSKDFTFDGKVDIYIRCIETSRTITLHSYRLDINAASIVVHHVNNTDNLYQSHRNDSVRQFLVLDLSQDMTQGKDYVISMSYTGPLESTNNGLYLSSYQDGNQTVYLATTQFEAPYARKAFPCYDEPALKATFNTTLRHKLNTGRNYTTLSNMDIIYHSDAGEYGVDKYRTTVVMPTYLLAFVICDYEYLEGFSSLTKIPYRTYARPNAIQHAELAQQHGVKIFDKYIEYFKPEYSLPKLDNIAIPDFSAGAMENWGLITYRESLLYEPGISTASTEKWIAEVISHEIAHQWFGNLVSPKWWKWLWLNEAFASFWDYHIVGEVYPTWRSMDLEIVDGTHSVLVNDALRTSHPMTHNVESNAEISSIFDSITYTKGSAIVRMMHFIMGQDLFITGLNSYLNAFKYGVAEHQDLWDKLTETAQSNNENLNMTAIMDPWVTQMNYPIVMVTKTSTGFKLNQKRFLIGSTDEEAKNDTAPYGYKWPIPISYTRKSSPDFNPDRTTVTMMPVTGATVELAMDTDPTNWIIINLQQHGYYRVNYEEENWNALISQLETDHTVIHPINRAQIINDAANSAKAGLLKTSIALRTLNYLKEELDYLPWRAFAREMGYVESMLRRTDLYRDFNKKMMSILENPLANLGLNITGSMEHIDVFVRTRIAQFACNHGVSLCVDTAVNKFKEWKDTSIDGINANLRSTFYCTAIKHGGFDEWEFIYHEYKHTQDAGQKDTLRQALACTREISLLQRLLDMSLDPSEIRIQDIRTTLSAVAGNPLGVDLAWNFFTHKFTELEASLRASVLSRTLLAITETFNTQHYLDLLQGVVDRNEVGSILSAYKQAIEATHRNMEWLKSNYNVYQTWLTTGF